MIDRTSDFLHEVYMQKRTVQSLGEPKRISKTVSEICNAANAVATDIQNTTKLLIDLERLVRRKGLFNDPAQQIQENTDAIKRNLSIHETALRHLETMVDRSAWSKTANHQHWSTVVKILRKQLLVIGRTFQHALRTRSENLKYQQQRRSRFASSWAPTVQMDTPLFQGWQRTTPVSSNIPTMASTMKSNAVGSQIGAESRNSQAFNPSMPSKTSISSNPNYNTTSHTLSEAQGLRRRPAGPGQAQTGHTSNSNYTNLQSQSTVFPSDQYSTQQMAAFQDARQRASDAAQVESTIVELGQMFTRMATVVSEQGEMVQRIDQDIQTAHENVNTATDELFNYFQMVSKDRQLIIKTFAVVIFVILLFSIFK